ncbi:MAG: hypothetical protein OSB70_08935 [Myxococcota bacterium]|jgi:hypothetical protein|nr:hypothetical protein [Myxococcota bacterium]
MREFLICLILIVSFGLSASGDHINSEPVVDQFIVNNIDKIRQAADRELCGYQNLPGFVGAAKAIMRMDRSSPSFPELSTRAQSYFTHEFYAVGRALLEEC